MTGSSVGSPAPNSGAWGKDAGLAGALRLAPSLDFSTCVTGDFTGFSSGPREEWEDCKDPTQVGLGAAVKWGPLEATSRADERESH